MSKCIVVSPNAGVMCVRCFFLRVPVNRGHFWPCVCVGVSVFKRIAMFAHGVHGVCARGA